MSDPKPGEEPLAPNPSEPTVPSTPEPQIPAAPEPLAPGAPSAPEPPAAPEAPGYASASYGTTPPPPPPAYGADQPAYAEQAGYGAAGGTTPPPAYGAAGYGAQGYGTAPPKPVAVMSLISMILGILGIVISLFAWGFGFVLSVAAVVLAFIGRKREPHGRAFWLTGMITGFAGIALAVIFGVIALLGFLFLMGVSNSYTY